MKKNVLFVANGNEKWIGGLYYIRNIIYTLLQNDKTEEKIYIYIYVNVSNKHLFESFQEYKCVSIIEYKYEFSEISLLDVCEEYKIQSIYPVIGYPFLNLDNICVHWIPDFQHVYLPEMFEKNEINDRDKVYKFIAQNHKRLILSSKDSYNTYKKRYPNLLNNIAVVHFVSFLEDELKLINQKFIKETMKKYGIHDDYVYLPNQFWKHKNHITVFKAINELNKKKCKNIKLICTGNTEDYRNKNYFLELIRYIEENKLQDKIKILGLVPRNDQLAIMMKANLVVQPSLFEGWGTVVEDAKVIGKRIIMSDINVHFEQKYENSIIFHKYDYLGLAQIIEENNIYTECKIDLQNTRNIARKYSQELFEIFDYNVDIKCNDIFCRQRSILMNLFKNSDGKNIGIYGTGEHTEAMLKIYKKIFGKIKFNIYFFDSNSDKWNKIYLDYKIFNPIDINKIDLDRIIISSFEWQEEIYEKVKRLEQHSINILKIYSKDDTIAFKK